MASIRTTITKQTKYKDIPVNVALLVLSVFPSVISGGVLTFGRDFKGFFPLDGFFPFGDPFQKSTLPSELIQTIWRYSTASIYTAILCVGVVRREFAIALLSLTSVSAALLALRLLYDLSQIH